MTEKVLKTNEYKGYIGSYVWHEEEQVYWGRLNNINHIITFTGKTIDEVKADFIESVDDFIEFV